MATVQTIATTLTADSRPAVQSLRTFDAEVGKAFSRLDAMNKRAFSSGGGASGFDAIGRGSSNAARGVLELSRGLEDFSSQFGTQGFAGGIRAASNNLSQMAFVMGGPLAGAIAGFAAAGLTLATPYITSLFDATEQTKKLKEETEKAIKAVDDLFSRRAAGNVRGAEFAFDLKDIDESSEAQSAIKQRQREARTLEEREFFNREQRDAVYAKGQETGFTKEITEELVRLDEEALSIAEKKLQVLAEITKLREKQVELSKQEAAEEFANRIREFQKQDERDEQRRQGEAKRDLESDRKRLEGALESRLSGLGGADPLKGVGGGLAIEDLFRPEDGGPLGTRERVASLLGEIDALNSRPRAQFAQVAMADSQALLRSQYQAKEAAERKKEADRLRKILEDMLRELREARKAQEDQEDIDDVNIG